jgi:tetratricopeptide (TPR) repeat protein
MKSVGPWHARTAAALNNFATASFLNGKRDEAFAYGRRALAILEPQAAQQPAELAKVLGNLGLFSLETGDTAGAEAYLKRAIAVAGPALGDEHPVLGPILQAYADLLRRTHRKREAKAAEQRAERIQARNARDNALGMTVDAQALLASKPDARGLRP